MGQLRDRMAEDLQARGYQQGTCYSYLRYCRQFVGHFMRSPEDLGEGEIRAYLDHLATEDYGRGVIAASACGLKFLYSVTLERPEEVVFLSQPKRTLPPPTILSQNELQKLLHCLPSLSVKAVVCVVATSDLGVNEACSLRPADIDVTRMLIRVQQPRVRRQRHVTLTEGLLQFLRQYWKLTRPPGPWLFPATTARKHISVGTVRQALRKAVEAASINRPVTDRVLKHSFRTQLLQQLFEMPAAQPEGR